MKHFILILLISCFSFSYAQENQKYINVNGTSELIVQADQIDFTIQIKIVDESVEASKKINDEYLNELLLILKNKGISTNDIEVSPITLAKHYNINNGTKEQNGFYTRVGVSFTLKDLSKYYELTNKLASTDHFEIIHSVYNISDYEIQHKAAYEQALKAAKEKAIYMCATIGVKLGAILEIEEYHQSQSYPNPFNTSTVINSQTGNITGKVTIKRSVRVKFAIE